MINKFITIIMVLLSINTTKIFAVDKIVSVNNSKTVSLIQDSLLTNDSLRINRNDFYFGDNPRFMFNGDIPYKSTHIQPTNFIVFSGLALGYMIGQHIYQLNTIWSESGEFRFIEDGNYGLYIDKVGHTYGSYMSSYFYTEMFLWSGIGYDLSHILGTAMGIAYTAYVEIMDGHAAGWGFSPSDFYSNVAGSTFFLLQHYIPFLQNFNYKFAYIPASWHGELERKPSEMFIDDYSSHTFYMSVNVDNLLPKDLKDYWPDWLQLTFGVAVRNLCDLNNPGLNCDLSKGIVHDNNVLGSPRYIIGLDYDLVKLLPDGPPVWNWFRQSLNYLKLPAPAIEFGPVTKFYLMYPFKIL